MNTGSSEDETYRDEYRVLLKWILNKCMQFRQRTFHNSPNLEAHFTDLKVYKKRKEQYYLRYKKLLLAISASGSCRRDLQEAWSVLQACESLYVSALNLHAIRLKEKSQIVQTANWLPELSLHRIFKRRTASSRNKFFARCQKLAARYGGDLKNGVDLFTGAIKRFALEASHAKLRGLGCMQRDMIKSAKARCKQMRKLQSDAAALRQLNNSEEVDGTLLHLIELTESYGRAFDELHSVAESDLIAINQSIRRPQCMKLQSETDGVLLKSVMRVTLFLRMDFPTANKALEESLKECWKMLKIRQQLLHGLYL